MNPCPCGFRGDGTERCTCDPGQVVRYRNRVSGPLLDRVDMQLVVPRVSMEDLAGAPTGEDSRTVRDRVVRARMLQRERFEEVEGVHANAQLGPRLLRAFCSPPSPVVRKLQRSVDGLGLSARAYHRILKVARTVADLDGEGEIQASHVQEAVQYRKLDRKVAV